MKVAITEISLTIFTIILDFQTFNLVMNSL